MLREALKGILPQEIINRKKVPFPNPNNLLNYKIKNLCIENWDSIQNSFLINQILSSDRLKSAIDQFNSRELWFLLNIWRFEEVFSLNKDNSFQMKGK